MIRIKSYSVFTTILISFTFITLFLSSCEEEPLLDVQDFDIGLSLDTLRFDTVFTEIGTITRFVKVFNNESQPIIINEISIPSAQESFFRINVDGIIGPSVEDVRIEAQDSIWVFVEATINPDSPLSQSPFIIEDQLIVRANETNLTVQLEAFGQNANYVPSRFSAGEITGVPCNGTVVWDDPKPYVIYGVLAVDQCQLVIEAGTQIYVHGGIAINDLGVFNDGILLIIILVIIQSSDKIGITDPYLPPRIGFILVGIWWIGFASITFRILPKDNPIPVTKAFVFKGLNEVKQVFHEIKTQSNIVKFLMSYFFFIAGVNVVIYLATIFAEEELGFKTDDLIKLVLLLQFLAMVGAYLFAFLSSRIGNKISLLVQLVIWIVICFAAYLVQGTVSFYILALFVGLVFGGIQSLSRSTYSKMLSEDIEGLASYFSFYDVLTKLAIVSGTFVFGIVNQITGNMRYSILSTAVFFVLGFIILSTMKTDKKKESLEA